MVLEAVVTDVLNKILGDYVENLDSKQLKIGIWGGDVVLHNLKLRENALDEFDLPVQLVYGYLGKLVLKIPWKNLYSQPVVAEIEDFYILVSPKVSVAYDQEKEDKYDLQAKQTALQALEEAHRNELDKDKPKPDATFTEKLTAQIINNLQVKIANVHLRYEDTTTTGRPFAFGVTLHELEIYTTDVNWVKCYLTEQVSRVYKIANLDSLSAYMNCSAELYSDRSKSELANFFRNNIARKDLIPPEYTYVLGPISSVAKLRLNMNPQYDDPPFQIPKIDLCLEMEKLNIGLTSTQFQNILQLAESMNRMQLGLPYRKFRPFNTPYKNNYKIWWKFAITSVLEDVRKRNRYWTWDYMKEHRQLCQTYATSFKEKELCKKPSASLVETCTLLEQKLDLFNLILIRKRVQIDVDKAKEKEVKTAAAKGWFGGWFGGGKKDEEDESSDIVKKLQAAMTPEEKQKLYSAIGYHESATSLIFPEEYEAMNLNFKLIALEVGLYDDTKEQRESGTGRPSIDFKSLQTIMLLNFSVVTASIQQRPAASGVTVKAGVKEMCLTGLKQEDNQTPTMIESKVTDEFNLLDISFEMNPLGGGCDQRIRVYARPLQITYDSDTILHLMKVFSPPKAVNLSELEGAASERMANFKERSATGMQYVIAQKPILDIDIKFMPNILILPHGGRYAKGKSLIVVSLGQLHITSQPHAKDGSVSKLFESGKGQDEILQTVMSKAYDNYKISIQDIQLMVVKPNEPWEDTLRDAALGDVTMSHMHVLRPTTVNLAVGLCILDDDPRLPKTKVDLELPSIAINITESRTFEALKLVTSLPMPEGEEPEPAQLMKALSNASSKLSLASFLNQEKKKVAKKAADTLDTEIIQYTNLEVNFMLKEINVTLHKSCETSPTSTLIDDTPTSQSTKFGTPVEDMPYDPEKIVDVPDYVPPRGSTMDPEKVISFQILQVEAYMAQRTYEMVATAKLGAVTLKQYDHCGSNESFVSIIDTPRFTEEECYLLTVSYVMANKISPEFVTKYNSTEQLIKINFSTLNVTLHKEYLLYLMEIANKLQTRLESVSKPSPPKDRIASAADESIVGKLTTIMEEDAETEIDVPPASSSRKRRSTKVVESIKIHVVMNMEMVGLLLTCRQRPIAELKVEQFDVGVILKSSYTELNCRLRNILLTDLNPNTIHNSILSIVGTDALQCQVVMFNLDETSNYNKDDMKITVEIGCMKIVFLNWFVTSVLSFLNHFGAAQEALANASAAAAETAKQNALDAYQKATRMKLNIQIKAPIIVVPVDSLSSNALALDLGFLSLTNTISELKVSNTEDKFAVLDDIKLELKRLKLTKVAILTETTGFGSLATSESADNVDFSYGLRSDTNILNPTSFTLGVKRNLSAGWYKELPEIDVSGRLHTIELNLFMEDYELLMSILKRNLSEGVNEFPPPPRPTVRPPTTTVADIEVSPTKSRAVMSKLKVVPSKPVEPTKVYEQLKFNFLFEGIIINLIMNNNEGLARFGLYYVSMKGTQLINGTLSTSIVLCNIQIDDTRPNNSSKITQYLCRKDWKESSALQNAKPAEILETCRAERNFMLDITAIMKTDETFAEVRVCGFDLILCVDYLFKLATFFTLPDDTTSSKIVTDVEVPKTATTTTAPRPASAQVAPVASVAPIDNSKKVTLTLHIEEPDIILVESLSDINTNAIIFNAQAQLNYRAIGEKQLINGQIDAMKMYMCSFVPERREATKHYIIHPCFISLQGSTPEEEGLHISLKLSEIIVNVSPATIELLNKAMQTINAGYVEKTAIHTREQNFSSIWEPRQFTDKEHWFIRVDQADDVLEVIDQMEDMDVVETHHKTERCVIEVPCITLVVETGVGYYTTPFVSIDTRLNAVASDWSRQLSINGSLTLNMNYYNPALAVWEPIIEMNEHLKRDGTKHYLPWELNFGMNIESKKSEFDENVMESTTKIKIHSDENLEMTMTKTCLDVLKLLGESFSQAIDEKGLVKPDVIAPYVIENDTGFDIQVNFRRGVFTLHECHMPQSVSMNSLNRSVIFQMDETDAAFTPEQVKDCTISPGGRVYLQTKDLSCAQSEEDEEYSIFVKVGGIVKELKLSVDKSDTRYFPLYRDTHQDPWGIISQVRSEFGTTAINIHGVVSVYNHFTTTIQVYRRKPNSYEKILVGEVPGGKVYHVPLHAIYSETKELYFTMEGYNVSVQGFKWNDSPTDLEYSRQLQCDPIETYEPFYINASRQKTEVFYENSNKYKLLSAFYTVHLRPPLYLRNALPIGIKVSVTGCSVRQNGLVGGKQDEIDGPPKILARNEDLLDYGEKNVNPGHCLHLPTVKISGKSKEGKSYLVVRLIQYLEKDWSCTTEISADHSSMAIWTFTSYDSETKMDMDLCVLYENRYGSMEVILYSPFWMINKTGLMLSYKAETETVDVLYHPPEYDGPILFSFREKFFFDKKSASIRINNGEWSTKIPLDVAGSIGEVTCKTDDMSYQIGVHNHLTNNSLTKQITFIPFYIASNNSQYTISLQEQSRPGDPWIQVEPNECVPLWPKNDSNHMIVAKIGEDRTAAFNYSEMQCTLLQLKNNQCGGINVDVQTTEGGVFITFTTYNRGDAPGLLINHTSKDVVYREKGQSTGKVLKSLEEVLYTWHDPSGDKLLLFGKNNVENDLRRDGVGEFKFADGSKAYWVSFLDGLQRVLLFTEVEAIASKSECSAALQTITQSIEVCIHGIGLSILNNETGVDIMYLGITSSGIIWESKKPNKKRFKQMNMHDTAMMEAQYQQYLIAKGVNQEDTFYLDNKHEIDFERMTLHKGVLREIKRTFYPGVWISMKTSPFQTQLHAKINNIQLDNQLADCIFPVVLAPIAPPKSLATSIVLKPFVECSVVQRVVPNSTVKQFKYATMLIQEFHFKVDILFLTAIAEMFSGKVTDEQAAKLFNEDVESIRKPLSDLLAIQMAVDQKNFYDNLHLGPLKIHVSFSMAGSDTTALPGFLSTLVQGVGVTLTDVNDVVFRLAFFEREYQFFTQSQIISEITAHYTGQALKQLYVLVLGLDVLGNPYGLVVGLKKGVEDLFYEPFQGAIQGPGEFAEGLVLGVKSLFGHTVGGAAGAVSKITGAMGKGLAALTFDDDYQRKRRQALNKKPTNFQEGIARSGKGLVMGFVDGVTGVVTKPMAGAREEGVEGFFKGLGKGAIGLVARPTAGVVDFASGSFEAVKRATEHGEEANRLRPPRFLHQDNVLRPYCREEAEGNKMLKEIEKGKYATTDVFVHCEEIVTKHEYVIVSNHRVIYVTKNDLFGSWTVQWTYLWHEIQSVKSTDRGVEITLKKDSKKVMGLFSVSEAQRKVILMANQERRNNLQSILESHRVDA